MSRCTGSLPARAAGLLAAWITAAVAQGAAAATEIATEPLSTLPAVRPKPNVMFLLDDSSSMDWLYMPDDIDSDAWYGYWSSQCNGIAFDPSRAYPPPVKADGSFFPDVSFSAAPSDGYDSGSSTSNLKNSIYYTYSGTQKALGWTYDANGPIKSTTFYKECTSDIGASPGKSVFVKHTIGTLSLPSLKQKYANWYAYYRKRHLTMRASAGLAFQALDTGYRVGFGTINDATDLFLDVKDFDATQKTRFYDSLYKSLPDGDTPLRAALSRIGRYYAKKLPSQTHDPVQYSCQRDYTILSTDGYWNDDAGSTLAGKSIGQQDGSEAKPMHDGAGAGGSGGTSDTLADVAEYYYKTDLRTAALGNCTGADGRDVCANDVQPNGRDDAKTQHMTTFTIGMGVNGTLAYDPKYLTQTSGTYADLTAGRINWPAPSSNGGAVNVDDLWHAAVNGRGQYFSAKNSTELSNAIIGALSGVMTQSATGSGAGFSSQRLSPDAERRVLISGYTTGDWTGDLQAYTLDAAGVVGGSPLWSAQKKLDAVAAASRRIHYLRPGSANLVDFNYTNLVADGLGALFDNYCSRPVVPAQCAAFDLAATLQLVTGDELVSYLRGDDSEAGKLFRERKSRLGDIVNAAPVYVGRSPLSYVDPGHPGFVATTATRQAAVYVAANDGMLHAFSAADGSELWAYVPRAMMAEMYRLADRNYAARHRFFVDGTPVVADAKIGGVWKTVLVGGFNAGGRGYYALDVTDPANPKGLWEFIDANAGLSFGKPIVTKRANGTWAVAVTSGHNNADGKGHFYLLDLATGSKLVELVTSAGSAEDPSGLARIDAWVDDTSDNTALRFYGGDLLGNLWRFDPDDRVPPAGNEATLLATLRVGSMPQPITTAPRPVRVRSGALKVPAVAVATGRWLGPSDGSSTGQQSIYVIRDALGAGGVGNPRSSGGSFVQQRVTPSGTGSAGSTNAVDWSKHDGWYVDLPTSRERVVIDPLALGTKLAVASVVPNIEACGATTFGSSWMYVFSLENGWGAIEGGLVAEKVDNGIVSFSALQVQDGTALMGTDSKGHVKRISTEIGQTSSALRRSAWRELVD